MPGIVPYTVYIVVKNTENTSILMEFMFKWMEMVSKEN